MLSLTEIGCQVQKLYLDSRRETGKSKIILEKQEDKKCPSLAQIHLHVLSRNALHFIRSLSGEFLSSPWQQALIRDSCNYWLLESIVVLGTKNRGRQSLSYNFSSRKNMSLQLEERESPGCQDKDIGKGEDNRLRSRTILK